MTWEVFDARVDAGVCRACGKAPVVHNLTHCACCRAGVNARMRAGGSSLSTLRYCSECGRRGHNRRTCPQGATP
jgi:hypothetical protein